MAARRCLACRQLIARGSYHKTCDPLKQPGWAAMSALVLERDDWICHLCGKGGADTVDHLVPRALGGTNDPRLLKAAHRACNAAKRGA